VPQKAQKLHQRSPSEVYESNRHKAFALLLAKGHSIKRAAQEVLYNYDYAKHLARQPKMRRLVAKLHGEFTIQAAGELIDARSVAISALREMAGADTHDAVRLGAATKILEMMLKVQDVAEIRVMLEGIQKRLRETGGSPNIQDDGQKGF
jgi:hypothetical protein